MKLSTPLSFLLISGLVLSLAGCNLPAAEPDATLTATPTKVLAVTPTTIPASPTPIPPTDTPTVVQPTDTPTLVPPTDTPAAPTATWTNTPAPTQSYGIPLSRAKFEGTFANGELTLRIGENPNLVIPKLVTLRGAVCKEGGIINDSITFEPPPSFWITNGKFTISIIDLFSVGDQLTISGVFLTSSRASGTISISLRSNKGKCTVGPLNWTASMVLE